MLSWGRHQVETFSALLAFCVGNSPVTSEFPAQRPVTRSFDVFFDLCQNQHLSKQWRRRWFESHRAHNDTIIMIHAAHVYIVETNICVQNTGNKKISLLSTKHLGAVILLPEGNKNMLRAFNWRNTLVINLSHLTVWIISWGCRAYNIANKICSVYYVQGNLPIKTLSSGYSKISRNHRFHREWWIWIITAKTLNPVCHICIISGHGSWSPFVQVMA